uniref:Uncharacterized protein n=1 Tax=Arion vulgaris TaxID=1028688 RepID=A0A0B7BJN1_9EUPU
MDYPESMVDSTVLVSVLPRHGTLDVYEIWCQALNDYERGTLSVLTRGEKQCGIFGLFSCFYKLKQRLLFSVDSLCKSLEQRERGKVNE